MKKQAEGLQKQIIQKLVFGDEALARGADSLNSVWGYEWKFSNKYDHLAQICGLIDEEYKAAKLGQKKKTFYVTNGVISVI